MAGCRQRVWRFAHIHSDGMPLEPEPELTEAELRALTGEMERIRRMSPVSAAAALEDASRKSYSPPFSLSRSPGSSPGLEAAAQGTEELADALKEVSGLVMSSPRGMRAGPLGKQGLPVARPVARPRSPARTPAASPRTATPPRTRTAAATPPRTRSAILARSESRDTSAAFASRDFGAGDARAPKAPKQDSVLVSGGWKVIAGCAVSSAFLPMLSSEILHFGPNNIAVTRPHSWSKMKDKEAELATTARSSDAKLPTTLHPAALVAVPRESQKLRAADCNGAFVLAVVVDQLDPGTKSLAFGIGLMLPRSGQFFGEAEGTVGIIQSVYDEKHRQVRSKGRFGRRVDRSDDKLRKPIRTGSRVCMQLSPRDPGTVRHVISWFVLLIFLVAAAHKRVAHPARLLRSRQDR